MRLVDSISLWARRSAWVVSSFLVDVAVSGGLMGCFRFRNMDVGSSIVGAAAAAFSISGSCPAGGAVGTPGTPSPSISSSSSGP